MYLQTRGHRQLRTGKDHSRGPARQAERACSRATRAQTAPDRSTRQSLMSSESQHAGPIDKTLIRRSTLITWDWQLLNRGERHKHLPGIPSHCWTMTVGPRSIAVQPRLRMKKKHTMRSGHCQCNCLLVRTCAAKSAVSSERSQNSEIGTCLIHIPLVTNRTMLQLTVILYDHRKPRLVVFAGSIALIRSAPLSTRPHE
jgi:hypothetical protein